MIKAVDWKAVAGVGIALSTLFCRQESLPTPREVASQTDPDDVRAAALLHLYSERLHEANGSAEVACISVEGGAEPSNRLLMRLSGQGLNIRMPSRCAVRELSFVDAISGAKAVQVFVTSVSLPEPGRAVVEGGYQYGPLAGHGMAYTLEFQLGRWVVTHEQPTWIC